MNNVETEVIKALTTYSQFKRAITFEFLQFISKSKAVSVTSYAELMSTLQPALTEYSERTMKNIETASENIAIELLIKASEGYEENPFSGGQLDAIDGFIASMMTRVSSVITNQMRSDVLNLGMTLRRFLLRVEMLSSSGYDRHQAHESERIKLFRDIDLYRRDSLGRKRDSEGFVFTELRFGFYRAFNIGMVYLLSVLGDEKGRVDRPGHESHQKVIWLKDFEDMEGQLFHPNSTALLSPLT